MSIPSRTGLNVAAEYAGSDRQDVADKLCAMHAPFHLILDDYVDNKWFFTKQLRANSPQTKPIHRRYWYVDPNNPKAGGWDGSLHRAPNITAEAIVGTLEAQQRRGGVFPTLEQIYNEPDVHRNDDDPEGNELKLKNKLIVECVHSLARRGMGGVVDNPQERSLNLNEIAEGFYDEMIVAICMYPNMYYGIHKYGLGVLMGNISNAAIGKLGTMGAFPYASWRVCDDKGNIIAGNLNSQRMQYVANWKESHLCSGSVAMVNRAKELRKIPKYADKMRYAFQIVVTEAWWDHVILGKDGIITHSVDTLNNRLAMGYPALWKYWREMFKDENWTPAQAAFEQVRWMDLVEITEVVGICGYTIDTNFESGRYNVNTA